MFLVAMVRGVLRNPDENRFDHVEDHMQFVVTFIANTDPFLPSCDS